MTGCVVRCLAIVLKDLSDVEHPNRFAVDQGLQLCGADDGGNGCPSGETGLSGGLRGALSGNE
jgi:hypothetical protein